MSINKICSHDCKTSITLFVFLFWSKASKSSINARYYSLLYNKIKQSISNRALSRDYLFNLYFMRKQMYLFTFKFWISEKWNLMGKRLNTNHKRYWLYHFKWAWTLYIVVEILFPECIKNEPHPCEKVSAVAFFKYG